ncbi:hypothetical protein H2136_20740 [Aeromonas hydrophila]|uniref:Uncharacterized protein n=1 Tax=Aeromonas hydrophila TaxID=644 RepID=A0A926FNR3_AERHY|nr:hypothetical protein [Aeromonas hydrophila]
MGTSPCWAPRALQVELQAVPCCELGQTASGGCHALAAGDLPHGYQPLLGA